MALDLRDQPRAGRDHAVAAATRCRATSERPVTSTSSARRCARSGSAGPVFALIEQPQYGWGDPRVAVPLIAGVILLLIAFVVWERRTR